MKPLLHFSTLSAYCEGIQIPPPKNEFYDIRSFEENMKTVKHQMPPFKHEFFAIALKLEGSGFATTGNFTTQHLKATVFFNSPYQIVHWDIAPNWVGYYIIFSEEFYQQFSPKKSITQAFPFLLSDQTVPLAVTSEEAEDLYHLFNRIYFEHQSKQAHQEEIVLSFINILLFKTARLFYKQNHQVITTQRRDQDLALVARFKTLLETAFYPNQVYETQSPHQVQFYADKLSLHPNHLNALVKRITSQSASDLIQRHLLSLAKSKLKNTPLSVKEIAYDLYFNYPNHFSTFFKKQTGQSPNAFRTT
ncbi:MAG: helix-turn-helix domain-containing protein [Thermonemataceae bacterium]